MNDGAPAPSQSSPPASPTRRLYRYGDFPELFWDLRADAPVDSEHPSILARVITNGSLDAISKLVSFDVLRRDLDILPVPEHTRRFWRVVLDVLSEGHPVVGTSARRKRA